MKTRTIELDGRRLAWRSLGAGPPLVLVNGYAATAADWDPTLLGALAGSFQLICPDNRGLGDSDLGDPKALSIEAMAEDILLLLDALGLDRAHLLGWSMGGFVAQSFARAAPARVLRLALLATDPGGPSAVLPDPGVWAMLTDHAGTPRAQATRLLSLLFPSEVARRIDRMFGQIVADARAALSPEALSAQERAIDVWHATEPPPLGPASPAVGPGPPAVFVACGDADLVVPPANAQLLATRWPGARVEVFAGAGHAFMAQEPERLAELLAEFFGG